MSREVLHPTAFPEPPLGHASPVVRAGGWTFVSAQLASNLRDGVAREAWVDPDGPYWLSARERQSTYVLRQLEKALREVGCELRRDVARIYWWFQSDYPTPSDFEAGSNWCRIDDLTPLHEVRAAYIDDPQPASTGIGVRQLPICGALLSVGLIAVDPASGGTKLGIDVPSELSWIPDTPAVRFGDWIFVVGAIASDWAAASAPMETGAPTFVADRARVSDDVWFGSAIETQTEFVLSNIERIAEAAGTSLRQCVKAEVYVGHPQDVYGVDRVWKRWFGDKPPARVIVPYSGLAGRGIRIEIAPIFLAGDSELAIERIETSAAAEPVLHEPQAVKAGPFVFLSTQAPIDSAGQVPRYLRRDGLAPFFRQPAKEQTRFMLSNVASICEAAGTSVENVCRCNAFYDDLNCLAQCAEIWAEQFEDKGPAMTEVGLGHGQPMLFADARVELDIIAYAPPGQPECTRPDPRGVAE